MPLLLCVRHTVMGCFLYPKLIIARGYHGSLNFLITQKISKHLCLASPLVNQYQFISTLPSLSQKHHTVKGWKTLARDGVRPDVNAKSDAASCEEGREAVSHSVLISELQKCSSVSSQIEKFCSLVSITSNDIENRQSFSKSFDEAFSIYFPEFKVHLFGSSINRLGFKGCDSDICLQTNFKKEEYILQKDVPTLDSVLDGSVSQETVSRLNPLYMLRFVRRILRRHCPDIKEPILLIKARCPLLRFYNTKYDIFCDFSCESKTSVQNTMFLRLLSYLDDRFVNLAKVIRYWGKYGGFVGDIDMFNSYSSSLLVLHFLQTTNPPVLPPVKEILQKSEYLQHGSVDDVNLLLNDIKQFSASANLKTVEELLKEFFFYFLKFDYSRVMLPYTSSTVHRSEFMLEKHSEDIFEFNSVNVQDPFRNSFNATHAASYKTCKRFVNALVEACAAYQTDSLWVPGSSEKWGLSSLFTPPISENGMFKKWKENRFYTLEMPLIHGIEEKLKKIFEYGLLFYCKDFFFPDNLDDRSKQIFKMQCRAHANTWQGRDELEQSFLDGKGHLPLELEHLISNHLASKVETKRQVLCDFFCEGFEVREDNNQKLVLKLSFAEVKHPPIVAIFLREYLPSMLKNM